MLDGQLKLYREPLGLTPLSPSFVPDAGGQGSALILGPQQSVAWNGKNSNGQFVSGGTYTILMTSIDPFGKETRYTAALTVIREPVGVEVDIYNSAGELVKQFDTASDSASAGTELVLSSKALVAGKGSVLIQYGQGDQLSWNGTNDEGDEVQSGTYLVKLVLQEAGGPRVISSSIEVLDLAPAPLKLTVAPNPAKQGEALQLSYKATGASSVQVYLYSLPGELVARGVGPGAGGRIVIATHGFTSGIYLLVFESQGNGTPPIHATLKVALIE